MCVHYVKILYNTNNSNKIPRLEKRAIKKIELIRSEGTCLFRDGWLLFYSSSSSSSLSLSRASPILVILSLTRGVITTLSSFLEATSSGQMHWE